MKIVFSESADADLEAIAEHYDQFGADTTSRVMADINAALSYLVDYPGIGSPIGRISARAKLTSRYHFRSAIWSAWIMC